jgi:hypothetical protein
MDEWWMALCFLGKMVPYILLITCSFLCLAFLRFLRSQILNERVGLKADGKLQYNGTDISLKPA